MHKTNEVHKTKMRVNTTRKSCLIAVGCLVALPLAFQLGHLISLNKREQTMSWYDSEEYTTPRPVQNDNNEGIPGETRFLFQEANVVNDHRSSRTNKVILLGPHNRYNFGDLIFSKVVAKLLTS